MINMLINRSFFVGDSYAAGVNALEFNGYPNDFAYRHPLADAQFGGSYVWSGRTISTFTSDNILKSVLNICTDFGYQRIPETVNFEDVSDLIYSVKSILFEDVTEMDRVIYNSKGGSVIIYSVNKDNYNKLSWYVLIHSQMSLNIHLGIKYLLLKESVSV